MLDSRKDYCPMTEENYISLTATELSASKYTGHEHFLWINLSVQAQNMTKMWINSIFDLLPGSINDNCDFSLFSIMNPKAAILDAEESILLGNLDKP